MTRTATRFAAKALAATYATSAGNVTTMNSECACALAIETGQTEASTGETVTRKAAVNSGSLRSNTEFTSKDNKLVAVQDVDDATEATGAAD